MKPEITLHTRVPRAAFLRFPLGNPLGQPGVPDQHRAILNALLEIAAGADVPGRVYDLPFRWRRWPPGA